MPLVGTQVIDVFTGAMRTEFETAYGDFTAKPAEYEKFTLNIPSGSRVEHYPWISPTPAIAQFTGHRRLGRLGETIYAVPNLEFDASFEVELRDLRDDQTGGYMVKSRELAAKARAFPSRWVLTHLAFGPSRLAFDGQPFFANRSAATSGTPTLKVGGSNFNYNSNNLGATAAGTLVNVMAGTTSGSDSVIHNMVVFITDTPLRPMIWQARMDPELMDNLADSNSKFTKKGAFWVDLEGAAAYGRPHDALWVQFSNTPTVTDIQTTLGAVENQFRTFQLSTGLPGDMIEYVHEQLSFSESSVCVAVSPGLSNLMRQVLHQDTIVQAGAAVTNIYKGWADLVVSQLLSNSSVAGHM